MKTFDIQECLKNLWAKVEEVDKKAFWVFFIAMNVVFLYNSVFCLFGNEDIIVMFEKQTPLYAYFVGRYGVSLLEYFISNKTIIPMFINIILFFLLSISTVLTLNWLKLKKTLFCYILTGLFLLLSPTIYPILWYRSVCFGILTTMFFTIVPFFLLKNIDNYSSKLGKVFAFCISFFLLTVFVFGSYHPVIGTVFGLLFARVLIDFIDEGFSDLKHIVFRYKYIFLALIFSLGVDYGIFLILKVNGLIDNVYYPCANLIKLSEFYNYLIPFFTKTFSSFFIDTFPYVGIFYKSLLWLVVLFSIISLLNLKYKIAANNRQKIFYIFGVIFFFLFMFYVFNLLYFLSPVFYDAPRLFRLEYWTTTYFVFVCAVFAFKYSNLFVKNLLSFVLILLLFLGVQINMHIQKDQMISQMVELSRVTTLKNLILSNKDYEYSTEVKYEYVQIGNIKNSGKVEIYNSNDFNNKNVPEMISTFQTDRPFTLPLVVLPPKINNINPYSSEHINLISQLEKHLDDDFKNWLLYEAKSYPSENCVYIHKGRIYVVLEQKFLKVIKDYLGANL